MTSVFNAIKTKLDARLGRCPRCMRQAFLATLCAWSGTAMLAAIGGSRILPFAVSIAVALTVLWLSHLAAFAARVVQRGKIADRTDPVTPDPLRRAALVQFGRALSFGIVASSISPRFAAAADVDPCKVACIGQWNTCIQGCGYINDPAEKKICNDGCDNGRAGCYGRCG